MGVGCAPARKHLMRLENPNGQSRWTLGSAMRQNWKRNGLTLTSTRVAAEIENMWSTCRAFKQKANNRTYGGRKQSESIRVYPWAKQHLIKPCPPILFPQTHQNFQKISTNSFGPMVVILYSKTETAIATATVIVDRG